MTNKEIQEIGEFAIIQAIMFLHDCTKNEANNQIISLISTDREYCNNMQSKSMRIKRAKRLNRGCYDLGKQIFKKIKEKE
jgi:hypothetical protein